MNRKLIAMAISLAVASALGCSKKASSIEGKWAIDLPPMIQQAQSLNASSRDIESIEETFSNGRLEIDSQRITLTIEGINGQEVKEYVVLQSPQVLLERQSSGSS